MALHSELTAMPRAVTQPGEPLQDGRVGGSGAARVAA